MSYCHGSPAMGLAGWQFARFWECYIRNLGVGFIGSRPCHRSVAPSCLSGWSDSFCWRELSRIKRTEGLGSTWQDEKQLLPVLLLISVCSTYFFWDEKQLTLATNPGILNSVTPCSELCVCVCELLVLRLHQDSSGRTPAQLAKGNETAGAFLARQQRGPLKNKVLPLVSLQTKVHG